LVDAQAPRQVQTTYSEMLNRRPERKEGLCRLSRMADEVLFKQTRKPGDRSGKLKMIRVRGFEFLRIQEIRQMLFEAKFFLSDIKDVQWAGQTVLNLLVSVEYAARCESELRALGFRILGEDPMFLASTSTPGIDFEFAWSRFAARAAKAIVFRKEISVQRYYQGIVNTNRKHKEKFDKELAAARETKQKQEEAEKATRDLALENDLMFLEKQAAVVIDSLDSLDHEEVFIESVRKKWLRTKSALAGTMASAEDWLEMIASKIRDSAFVEQYRDFLLRDEPLDQTDSIVQDEVEATTAQQGGSGW